MNNDYIKKLAKKAVSKEGIIYIIGVLLVLIFILNLKPYTINNKSSNFNLSQPALILSYEDGTPISPDKVILDGKEIENVEKGKIILEGIKPGTHQIIIIIGGAKYLKTFTFTGNSISITLPKPVKVNIFVLNKEGKPLPNVKVYSDGELKCLTNYDGTCSFNETPGKHTFRLIGEGLFHVEIKEVSPSFHDFTFKIERKFSIKIIVKDKDSKEVIQNAKIYLDGILKGETSYTGDLLLQDISEGFHVVRVEYEGEETTLNINVNENNEIFEVFIKTPKKIEIKVVDELTEEPLEGVEIFLDGKYKGKTSSLGSLEIINVKQGYHTVEVKYKGVSKEERIEVSPKKTKFVISIKAPRTITLQLIDVETQKPIDFMDVFLEGTTITYRSFLETDDEGKTIVENVLPGTYQVRIEGVPTAVKPSKLITIGKESFIKVELDMPNPKFAGELSCDTYYNGFDEVGRCIIKVKNIDYERAIASQDTSVILLVYVMKNETTPELVGKHLIDFGKILPGEMKSRIIDLPEFQWLKKEVVVAVVLEGWKYTPKNEKNIGEISLPVSVAERWLRDLGDALTEFCKENPHECLKVIAGFFAQEV